MSSEIEIKLELSRDVVRRLWNVKENGSRIEVLIDQGEAHSGDRRSIKNLGG
ncbi:hypothetical protein K9B32_15895 [Rhizobium sp. 3T7]|uniref:hypothetical protein n=1 Tax=Rhizobium sp. 3T7 TaxID=2874922 RepID=UPI001CC9ABE7|nr:hypothetical protein [Rhizobium sp. 3T7]MBZ9791590.1 hypothetical protein [Rhizobium sp. 3T7]